MAKTTNVLYDLGKEYPLLKIKGFYTSLKYHRDKNPKKSQWIVSVDQEVDCFAQTKSENWISKDRGWGIIIQNKRLGKIGISVLGEDLSIARFECKNNNDEWHGYPADLKNKTDDIPIDDVLIVWRNSGYINKSEFIKIRRGVYVAN